MILHIKLRVPTPPLNAPRGFLMHPSYHLSPGRNPQPCTASPARHPSLTSPRQPQWLPACNSTPAPHPQPSQLLFPLPGALLSFSSAASHDSGLSVTSLKSFLPPQHLTPRPTPAAPRLFSSRPFSQPDMVECLCVSSCVRALSPRGELPHSRAVGLVRC